jgi:hypothetical protein
MPLTDTACKNAKCPTGKARERYADNGGLYLEVMPTGGKHWRWKYRFTGKEKRLALGTYPAVGLAQARRARDDALCAMGVVPERQLMNAIDTHLRSPNAPNPEMRFRAADRISETADSLPRFGHTHSEIDNALDRLDIEVVRPLLERVAERLIPEARQVQ